MFWAAALVLIAASLWFIGRPLLRDRATGPRAAELDLQVYKDQLAEVERDLERGVLSAAEADSARIEVSRRILAADKRLQAQTDQAGAKPAVNRLVLVIVAAVVGGGSLALYALIGSPDLPDQPLAQRLAEAKARRDLRPDQATVEAQVPARPAPEVPEEYRSLVAQLREAVAARPGDVEGLRLLALHEAQLGNFVAARKAQEAVIEVLGASANGEDYTALAEYLIYATNGYISPEAEESLVKALQLDPANPRARYFSGLALAQNGRPDMAYRMWTALLEEGPEDAPWIPSIRAQIGDVARAAGIDPEAEAPAEDATGLSPQKRDEMIRGMVSRLAKRLTDEGGPPEDWAQLIRAYGVLGDLDKAALVWAEAKQTFADDDAAIAVIEPVAEDLGIN